MRYDPVAAKADAVSRLGSTGQIMLVGLFPVRGAICRHTGRGDKRRGGVCWTVYRGRGSGELHGLDRKCRSNLSPKRPPMN